VSQSCFTRYGHNAFDVVVFYFICDEISWKIYHHSNFRCHSTQSESTKIESYVRI